jgi:hypothetical protein
MDVEGGESRHVEFGAATIRSNLDATRKLLEIGGECVDGLAKSCEFAGSCEFRPPAVVGKVIPCAPLSARSIGGTSKLSHSPGLSVIPMRRRRRGQNKLRDHENLVLVGMFSGEVGADRCAGSHHQLRVIAVRLAPFPRHRALHSTRSPRPARAPYPAAWVASRGCASIFRPE